MKRILSTAAVVILSAGLAACGSTKSGAHPAATGSVKAASGTEVIRAAVTGAKAAKDIASSSNKPLVFPAGTFTGPVTTRLAPFPLGGKGKSHGFRTPAGVLFVTHVKDKQQQQNPVVTAQAGRVCQFRQVFEQGTWKAVPGKSTGKFRDATGAGTYMVTMEASAKLRAGKSKCTTGNTGKLLPAGASLVFEASGPLTVKVK